MSNKSKMVSYKFWMSKKLTFEVLDLLHQLVHVLLDPGLEPLVVSGQLLVLKKELLIQLGPGAVAFL